MNGCAAAHEENLSFVMAERADGELRLGVEVAVLDLHRLGVETSSDAELADALARQSVRVLAGGAYLHLDYVVHTQVDALGLDVPQARDPGLLQPVLAGVFDHHDRG